MGVYHGLNCLKIRSGRVHVDGEVSPRQRVLSPHLILNFSVALRGALFTFTLSRFGRVIFAETRPAFNSRSLKLVEFSTVGAMYAFLLGKRLTIVAIRVNFLSILLAQKHFTTSTIFNTIYLRHQAHKYVSRNIPNRPLKVTDDREAIELSVSEHFSNSFDTNTLGKPLYVGRHDILSLQVGVVLGNCLYQERNVFES